MNVPRRYCSACPNRDEVTAACIAALANRQIVRLDTVTCVNDFKLLLISWAFDLNFATSHQLLQRNGYLSALATELPKSDAIRSAIALALEHVAEKSGQA